uniref:Uncharacterized protein n=1 Tax=Arundo donax TaxID=35708 RepID=A0A0A9FDV0_ARUDO
MVVTAADYAPHANSPLDRLSRYSQYRNRTAPSLL